MKTTRLAVLGSLVLLVGCGPTPGEQHALDQGRCAGFGFQPGTDQFAHCMMGVSSQREAQDAADRRAAADRAAADQRAQAARQAAKDKADRDAWDRRTGQGAYASPAPQPTPFSDPVDPIRKSVQDDIDKIQGD
ncbi:MAG: hypothetical protein WA864_00130 [Acetobacteraceae bacterium]|jgi:hypothetical protein